jgi:hypothetical protein
MAEKTIFSCDSCGTQVLEDDLVRHHERTGRRGRPRILELCPSCAASLSAESELPATGVESTPFPTVEASKPTSSAEKTGGAIIDLDRLLKLRLVVARHGEMDRSAWWNTRGMLGQHGAMALRRGLPRTHRFAQARVVFAVARARCRELFDPPGSVTLWTLPAAVEDEFDEHWQAWLAAGDEWTPLFEGLADSQQDDLLTLLDRLDLVSPGQKDEVHALRRSAEGRAVQLPGEHQLSDSLVTLLAAGFAKGERGAPAIPYAKLTN